MPTPKSRSGSRASEQTASRHVPVAPGNTNTDVYDNVSLITPEIRSNQAYGAVNIDSLPSQKLDWKIWRKKIQSM